MKVEQIVYEFLKEEGFDGLYNEVLGCVCADEDLAPCGDMKGWCQSRSCERTAEMSIKVEQIVYEFLKEEGFDGLYNEVLGCVCAVEDLAPCGDMKGWCKPGYRRVLSKADVASGAYNYKGEWSDGVWVIAPAHHRHGDPSKYRGEGG